VTARFTPGPLAAALLVWLLGTGPAQAQQAAGEAQPADFTLAPRGYLQFDLRGYPDWDVVGGQGRTSRPGVEIRRARLAVDGTYKRLGFELSIDPQDVDGTFVKDAYAQMRFSRALRIRAGQFKAPGTRDYDQSARNMDFIERMPLTLTLGVGRDIGVRADGRIGRLLYEGGLFAGDGVRRNDRSGLTGATRVALDLPNGLEIGASLSLARTRADETAAANGPSFYGTTGYRFADGVYVQGRRTRVGADVQWTPGRWTLVAEYLRLHDERLEQGLDFEDLPAAIGTGFSASVVRRLRTRQDRSGNLLLNAVLRRPLDVALRYDFTGLDDAAGITTVDSVRPRATDIRARGAHALTFGSTWAVSTWMKLLGNLSVERFTDARSAPVAGRTGPFVTLGTRLQVEWQ
jgi:phosphate-selective porin